MSPSNILVARSGVVKLLDFGIAKAASGIRNEKTRTGIVKGKVSYMSPEQADARQLDRRSDVFALGIVFWESLTTRRLFHGSDDLHTLRLVREAEVESPPDVSVAVQSVVMKMLTARREDRYASCDEVVAALAPLVRQSGVDGAALARFVGQLDPEPATPPVRSDVVTVMHAEHEPATRPHQEPRRRWPLVFAGALALGLSSLGVVAVFGRGHSPSLPTEPRASAIAPAPERTESPGEPRNEPPVEPVRIASPIESPRAAPPPPPESTATARVRAPARHHATAHKRAARSPELHDPFSER